MSATEMKAPVRGQAQPGQDCRSAEAARNPIPKPKRCKQSIAYRIEAGAGEPFTIAASGRVRWAFDRQHQAEPSGCMPVTGPAPRWTTFVHSRREHGVSITTSTQPHGSAFAGHRARYVLRAPARAERPGLGCGMTEAPNPARPARAQETADDWPNVVAAPAPGWRVIVCRDGLQWILQRRKNGGAERPWRAIHYCRTREALLRLCASLCGQVEPIAQATLVALPDHIGRAGK